MYIKIKPMKILATLNLKKKKKAIKNFPLIQHQARTNYNDFTLWKTCGFQIPDHNHIYIVRKCSAGFSLSLR